MFEYLKIVLINIVAVLIMSAKLATLGLLKIKAFQNKCYDAIIFVHDIINKILSCDSNYIVDVVMWHKFGNSSVSMGEVIIPVLLGFDQKTSDFDECSWLKLNILGLALGIALTFYTSVAKRMKLKIRKFWRLIPTFVKKRGKLNWRI